MRSLNQEVSAHASIYSNENSPNFNLLVISRSVLVQRAHNQTGNGIRSAPETSYSNVKCNRYACALLIAVASLHADIPDAILLVVRAQPDRQWHQDFSQRLATAMRSGIDWHVHSPCFNLHADIHGSVW